MIDDLEGALPPPELRQRILSSRARGVRVALPVANEGRPALRRVGMFVAAAAIVALWMGTRLPASPETGRPLNRGLFWGTPFLPTEALGQGTTVAPSAPRYPLVAEVEGARVRAGSWHYTTCTTTDDILTTCGAGVTITIEDGSWNGEPAWVMSQRVTTSREWSAAQDTVRSLPDTLFVEHNTLRPVYRRSNGPRMRLVQRFERDSVRESFDYTGPPPRNWQVTAALPGPPEAPLLVWWTDASVTLLVQGLPLQRGWRGSVYSIGLVGKGLRIPPFVPVDFRVLGAGRVTVPAGEFDCWKVELIEPPWGRTPVTLWVSKDRGWLIKAEHRGSDWRSESVLTSHAATPPAP
ncbi:MAG TPA: hypothetical protein VKC15_02915 [Gemmatimonadales bacterium]|nr:hypothetical protein [Gemmatimonadales bacterium]